ncbi:MAG: GNAT family N-acetyltransferase [Candidatus Hodarchaeales archaeon]|jgi:ribosomal protein S18 acetylase RimI-like enzyme
MTDKVIVRQATIEDIPDLVKLRRMMFEWMGYDDSSQLDASDEATKEYFSEAIPTKEFRGWLAVTDGGEAVGSGGLVIDKHPPGPRNLTGKIGYIMNLVTDPRYRRQGIARSILKSILKWLVNSSIKISSLHATEMGKALYEELGFVDSNEMVLEMLRDT